MSIETEKRLYEGFKGLLWVAFVVVGFLIVDKLAAIEKKLEQLDSISNRVIRIEYELKLRPN